MTGLPVDYRKIFVDCFRIKVLAPVSNYFLIRGQRFENRETLIPALIRSYRNAAGTDYHPAIAGIIMATNRTLATNLV